MVSLHLFQLLWDVDQTSHKIIFTLLLTIHIHMKLHFTKKYIEIGTNFMSGNWSLVIEVQSCWVFTLSHLKELFRTIYIFHSTFESIFFLLFCVLALHYLVTRTNSDNVKEILNVVLSANMPLTSHYLNGLEITPMVVYLKVCRFKYFAITIEITSTCVFDDRYTCR